MGLYKETTENQTVQIWYAARNVIFNNPINDGEKRMLIDEVKRISFDGAIREEDSGRSLSLGLQATPAVIPLINPETYEQILDADGKPVEGQTITDQQLAYFIASAYIYAAKLKDAEPPAQPEASILP